MSNPSLRPRARLLFDPTELAYSFGSHHPFQSDRLVALMDLMESSGLWNRENQPSQIPLRAATDRIATGMDRHARAGHRGDDRLLLLLP